MYRGITIPHSLIGGSNNEIAINGEVILRCGEAIQVYEKRNSRLFYSFCLFSSFFCCIASYSFKVFPEPPVRIKDGLIRNREV